MARSPRNPLAVKELTKAANRLARRKPATAKDIELWAYKNLGLRVSNESIRKVFVGEVDPTQCTFELLAALAGFYGADPAELGRFAEQRFRPVLAFAGMIQPPNTPDGQELPSTIWKTTVVDLDARRIAVRAKPATPQRVAAPRRAA